jgi:hypothetical protein
MLALRRTDVSSLHNHLRSTLDDVVLVQVYSDPVQIIPMRLSRFTSSGAPSVQWLACKVPASAHNSYRSINVKLCHGIEELCSYIRNALSSTYWL